MDQRDVTPQLLDELDAEEEKEAAESYVHDATVVERLMEAGEEIVGSHVYGQNDGLAVVYDGVYDDVKTMLDGVAYDSGDLEGFVRANVNRGADAVRGIYTGALAELLTRREDGITRIHVDGGGQRFDYLFAMAGELDEVYVRNFKGDSILAGAAGGMDGRAEYIAVDNLVGDRIGESIGDTGGSVGTVVFSGVRGSLVGKGIGTGLAGRSSHEAPGRFVGGEVDTVIFDGVNGISPGDRMGVFGGQVGTVLLREFPMQYVNRRIEGDNMNEEDVERLISAEDLPKRYREKFPLDYGERRTVEEAMREIDDYLESEGAVRRRVRRARQKVRQLGATVEEIYDG